MLWKASLMLLSELGVFEHLWYEGNIISQCTSSLRFHMKMLLNRIFVSCGINTLWCPRGSRGQHLHSGSGLRAQCGRVFGLAYQKHHTDGSAGYRVIIIKMKHHVVKPETGMLLLLFNDYSGEILTPLSVFLFQVTKWSGQAEGWNLAANSRYAHATFSVLTASSSLLYSFHSVKAVRKSHFACPGKPGIAPIGWRVAMQRLANQQLVCSY